MQKIKSTGGRTLRGGEERRLRHIISKASIKMLINESQGDAPLPALLPFVFVSFFWHKHKFKLY